MKRFLFLLLVCFSMYSYSQIQRTVTFDFSNPNSLNPKITPRTDMGGYVLINDVVFNNGPIRINFEKFAAGIGTHYFTYNVGNYALRICAGSQANFSTTVKDAVINSFSFSSDTDGGDMYLVDRSAEEETAFNERNKLYWSPIDNVGIPKVSLRNGNHDAFIKKISFDVTLPSVVLQPTSNSLDNGDVVERFESLILTFDKHMQIENGTGIILKNIETGVEQSLKASVTDNVISLSVDDVITEDGDYTISIPAKAFKDEEGYENVELTYNFKVYVPRNTFNEFVIEPELGKLNSLNDTIFISYSDVVKLDPEAKGVVLNKDGKPLYQLDLSVSEDKKTVYLTHGHGDIVESGFYTLTVPEKTIHNDFLGNEDLDRYNAKINLEWTVDNTPIDTETMKAAKALLANTDYLGLGYPAVGSESRTKLQELTVAETVPSDDELMVAIGAFYNETNVTMPTTDQYYKLVGVNASGNKLYLAYQNGSIVLTANAKEGAPFLVRIISDNTVTLQTRDGKYLHVLTAKPATGSAPTNVSDTYNAAINNLTLAKLKVAGIDSTLTMGLFSLSGLSINTNNLMHSQLNYDDNAISSREGGGLAYATDNSCAFVLEETDQYADVTVTDLAATLTPAEVKKNSEKLTLSFTDVELLTLENSSAPYFIDDSGANVTTSVSQLLTPVSGSTSSFSVNLSGLADGTYTLVIPQYTLFYTKEGKVMTSSEIKKVFTIKAELAFSYTYETFIYMQEKPAGTPYTDVSLNDFVLYNFKGVPYSGMVADESKEVRLALFSNNKTIRTGHLVAYPEIKKYADGYDNAEGVKLVFDKSIEKGELPNGEYTYVIPAGTIGDANYGKYLKGDKTIKPEDCIVNAPIYISVIVNNEAATPKYPSDELVKKAKELLAKSGLGYPTTTSAARVALQEKVNNSKSGEVDDAILTAAMKAFYRETDVVKPTAGKYYTIAGVASNDKAVYLQYDGTNVTLTTDKTKATGFKTIIDKNGVFTFKTGDGKYLHTLVNNNYSGTSKTNVTSDSTIVNRLYLTPFGHADIADDKSFGLFGISGVYDKNADGSNKTGCSLVNVATTAIEAPSDARDYFTEAKTNAFRFAEIDKAKIPAPAVKYTLTPANKAELLSLKQVTVTFSYPAEVTIADKSKVTLKDATGKAVAISGVALASGSKNKVNITFAELASGTYTLSAAEGAFTYTFAEAKKNVPAITATYTVPAKPELKYTLSPASGTEHEALSSVTLTISSPTGATLKDASKVTLVDANKQAVAVQVKATDKAGVFNITFNKLAVGTYTLTAAQGAFVYTLANTELQVGAITATYTVKAAPKVTWAVKPVSGTMYEAGKLSSVELSFTSSKPVILADKNKVTLTDGEGKTVTINSVDGKDNKFTVAFDALSVGTYTLKAAKGAFTYQWGGETVQVDEIIATYTVDARSDVKLAIYPDAGSKFEVLPYIKLTFTSEKQIALIDRSKIKLVGMGSTVIEPKNVENEGNVYTITFDDLSSGLYTFTVEKGAFAYQFMGENVEVEGTSTMFTILPKPQITWTSTPEPETPLMSLNNVTLSFNADRSLSLADKSKVTLTDEAGNAIALTDVVMDKNVCSITFNEITTPGSYTLTAAQGAFTYQFGNKPTPVEPIIATYLVQPVRPSDVVMNDAKKLLDKTGIGYPSADSKSRKTLAQLVKGGVGSDEDFQKAMDAFVDETDVEMPAADKYYRIVAIRAAKDTAYVSYDKEAASLIEAETEATPLKLTEGEDGNYMLTTADGKQQVAVTLSKKEIAENKIGAFGLFSISTFDDLKAIGFTFAEVDKADIPVPEVAYVVTPESGAVLEVLDTVTVSFTGYDDIALVDKTKFTLVNASNEKVELKSIEPVEGSNKYVIAIGVDEPGTYTLTIDKGAFSFDYADLTHQVGVITATYKVAEPRPSEPVLAEAIELLKNVGLGYPTAESDARKSLSDLVESEHGTDDVFTKAMDDFYAETNVVMPAVDKYYHIVAITAANDTAYVNQEGSLTGLVTSEAEATPLKLTKSDEDGYVLTTADGQWQLNVSISKKANAEDAKSVFGLFSIDPFDKIKAIGFTFAEVDKADIPVPQIEFALTPKSGTEMDVLDSLTLTFTGYHRIDLADDSKVYLKGDSIVQPVSIELAENSQTQYVMCFGALDVPGYYELTVEKGAFTFAYADSIHQVGAITAKYVVKEPVPSDSVLAAAKELLKLSGVGYPASDSESRVALDSLINGGKGKDEVFEAAMAAFLAETDIEQPAAGKYYRVAAVTSTGAEGFVTYEDGNVGLTSKTESPTVGVFRVTANEDGTLMLSTYDSKYECNVKSDRLTVENISAEETFGLFSLCGTLGGNAKAYSRVSIENGEWLFLNSSVLDKSLGLMLDEDMTTAFRFTEVAEEDLVIPEVTFALAPADDDEVEQLDVVKLSFTTPFAVLLKDANLISLKNENGTQEATIEVAGNNYELSFVNVLAGTYTLEIAEGAFAYNFFDKKIPVKAITATYNVKKGADFAYDFDAVDFACQLAVAEGQEYVKDTDLNTLTVGFKGTVKVNSEKTVFVVDEIGAIMTTGHLDAVEDVENEYRFIPDTLIPEGSLTAGAYTFVFEEGLFGDANYAKYLADPMSVLMSDCHVNGRLMPFTVKVDNEKAEIFVGIHDLSNGESSDVKWYDLNGRRVVGKPQKGRVYIVNGKKVTY